MKKTILTIIACLLAVVAVNAQNNTGRIDIRDLKIEEQGDAVSITFRADIPRRTVKSNYTLVGNPVITDGSYSISLSPIIVQGRTAEASRKRQEMVTDMDYYYPNAVYTRNGQSVDYTATVPSQRWMQSAELKLETVLFGCCSMLNESSDILAHNIPIRGDRTEYVRMLSEAPQDVFIPKTLADTLSISFPFVANIAEFDSDRPFRIYDDERDNALIVYFGQSSKAINNNYRDNRQTLTNITSVVSMIMNDRASNVERIVVAGFASPEGSRQVNDRLAGQRAEAVMNHIKDTCAVPENKFVLFNGSVDWQGLRILVEQSDMPEKRQVLDIIDNTPIWDSQRQEGRLGELQRLNGGHTYRYMFDSFFPNLRNGAFIKVYYKNIDD